MDASEKTAKQLTIRDVDEPLRKALEEEARARQLSINQTVVYLLRVATGLHRAGGKRRTFHDLDHLAGTWSREQAEDLGRTISAQRPIDEDLWR